MVVKSPALRRSRRLIEKEERKKLMLKLEEMYKEIENDFLNNGTDVGSEMKAERAWSTSPCVSHGDSVAVVKVKGEEEEGNMAEDEDGGMEDEEDGGMVGEDDELLAVPLADYDDNEENFCKKESTSSPSSPLPYSPQGYYSVGMYPSNAAISNWRHPATGFSLKKTQREISREFQRNRCKWQGRTIADREESDTESERAFHLRCQQMSPSSPQEPVGEEDAEMDHSENNIRTIRGGGFQDWV